MKHLAEREREKAAKLEYIGVLGNTGARYGEQDIESLFLAKCFISLDCQDIVANSCAQSD